MALKKSGFVEVNNSAFRVNRVKDPNLRDWWIICMTGQIELVKMLYSMEPVPTEKSAEVTYKILSLQETCEQVEYQVYQAATDTATLFV